MKRWLLFVVLVFAPWGTIRAEEPSLWKELMKLGGSQKASKKILSEYIRFWKSSLYSLKVEENAQDYWEKFRDNLNNFDIANIHQMITHRLAQSPWRAMAFGGKRRGRAFRIALLDPHIENWAKQNTIQWSSLRKMGDFEMKIFTRPSEKSDEDTYKIKLYGRSSMGPLTYPGLLRSLDGYLQYVCRRSQTDSGIAPQVERDFPDLATEDQGLLSDLFQDLPRTYKMVHDFWEITSLVEPQSYNGKAYTKVGVSLRYRLSNLKNSYYDLYRYLKKIRGLIKIRGRIYNEDGYILGNLFFDSKKYTLRGECLLRNGRFIPCTIPWEPAQVPGQSPILSGTQKLKIILDIKINLKGIQVVIRNFQIHSTYTYDPKKGGTLKFVFNQEPIVSKVSGSFYGIIPVWLIDMVIPSNILDLVKSFFKILATSNSSRGSVTTWKYSSQGSSNFLELESQSEFLNNGLIKLGLQIFNELFLPDEATKKDMLRLNKKIWHSFVSDYLRFSYR